MHLEGISETDVLEQIAALCCLAQGTSMERDLLAGGARAVHWPNVYKPKLQLCLRLHAAGWQWSGAFAVDSPGDLFVKIRHRFAFSFGADRSLA